MYYETWNTGQLVHQLNSSKPNIATFLPLFLNELIIVACSFIFTNVKTSWRKLLFWKIHYQSWPATSGWKYFCEFELSRSENLSTYQQINGAGISAGAANICVNARARTTPARVCSAPPRSAALGWSLIIGGTFNCSYYLCREPTIIIAMIAISIELWKNNTLWYVLSSNKLLKNVHFST